MSARLLIAVADEETARRAAAVAREAELEVVDIATELDEIHRGLRRLDVDVVLLHDDLGGTPVLDLARELASAFPEVGLILLAAAEEPGLLRAAMQAGVRDVITLPVSLESFEASVRAASGWARTMRDRVTGEESASGALGGPLIVVAGSKGGVGTTTVALHLGLAVTRMAPGRPVCLVDFDLQKGDFRALVDTPYRRSVVDLVDVANEISVRHLQETLFTHKDGFRLLLAPDDGERAEDVDAVVARNVLSAVKARHALTVVDIGAVATEATAIAAEMASQVLIVTTPDVLALRGVRRMRELWKRIGVREDEDVKVLLNQASRRREIQPDLARKVVGDTMLDTTIPADFNALEAAVNTGSPSRLEDNKLRSAYESLALELEIVPQAEEADRGSTHPAEPRGLLARLGGERGQTSVEFMGLVPILLVIVFGLWQIAITGYTYVVAGHAAREGARRLAVLPSDSGASPPYREAAKQDLPKGWRPGADITKPTAVTVKVSLKVPVLIPAFHSPLRITTTADTSVEDEPVPARQRTTPEPQP
jgi:pilus assembly protein CpaE